MSIDTFAPTPQAALQTLRTVRPSEYARTRNHIGGAVTRLSPYLTHGLLPMPDVMALAHELTPRLEAARATSPLPRYPDAAAADRVLRMARDEAARRWIHAAPGPWGEGAPVPPEAKFDA